MRAEITGKELVTIKTFSDLTFVVRLCRRNSLIQSLIVSFRDKLTKWLGKVNVFNEEIFILRSGNNMLCINTINTCNDYDEVIFVKEY